MCQHPETAKRRRERVIRGYLCVETYCRECRNEYQRKQREKQRVFRVLSSMPVIV